MITETRHVAATPDVVHGLLVDVEAWQLWSPHILHTDPSTGTVLPGWRGRVRPWFGPATTMHVTDVEPGAGMRWQTRALGHELRYVQQVSPDGGGSRVTFEATVHGPAASLVESVVGRLSSFGQRRRLDRLALLAEREARAYGSTSG